MNFAIISKTHITLQQAANDIKKFFRACESFNPEQVLELMRQISDLEEDDENIPADLIGRIRSALCDVARFRITNDLNYAQINIMYTLFVKKSISEGVTRIEQELSELKNLKCEILKDDTYQIESIDLIRNNLQNQMMTENLKRMNHLKEITKLQLNDSYNCIVNEKKEILKNFDVKKEAESYLKRIDDLIKSNKKISPEIRDSINEFCSKIEKINEKLVDLYKKIPTIVPPPDIPNCALLGKISYTENDYFIQRIASEKYACHKFDRPILSLRILRNNNILIRHSDNIVSVYDSDFRSIEADQTIPNLKDITCSDEENFIFYIAKESVSIKDGKQSVKMKIVKLNYSFEQQVYNTFTDPDEKEAFLCYHNKFLYAAHLPFIRVIEPYGLTVISEHTLCSQFDNTLVNHTIQNMQVAYDQMFVFTDLVIVIFNIRNMNDFIAVINNKFVGFSGVIGTHLYVLNSEMEKIIMIKINRQDIDTVISEGEFLSNTINEIAVPQFIRTMFIDRKRQDLRASRGSFTLYNGKILVSYSLSNTLLVI